MNKTKVITSKIFDIIELYLPNAAFALLFICYIAMIAYRYIFYASLSWVYETSLVAFVWCSLFASSYGSRTEKHVAFTILYDKLSENGKLIVRTIGNLIILAIYFILIPYTYKAMNMAATRKTPIMGWPFSIIYLPFIIYVILTCIHHAVLVGKDVKQRLEFRKGRINR